MPLQAEDLPDDRTLALRQLHNNLPEKFEDFPNYVANRLQFQMRLISLRPYVRVIVIKNEKMYFTQFFFFPQENAYLRTLNKAPLPGLTVSKLMNQRECSRECTRLKKLLRERNDWFNKRNKEATKQTRENKKEFEKMQKERAKEAEAAERKRIADEARESAEQTIRSQQEHLGEGATEAGTSTGPTARTSQASASGQVDTDEPIGETGYAEDEDMETEVISKHVTKSRAGPSPTFSEFSSPIRRRGRSSGSSFGPATAEDILARVGALVTGMSSITKNVESLENTLTNRHDVSYIYI